LIVAIVQFGIIYKPLWNKFEKIKLLDTKLCGGTSQNLTTKKHMVWHIDTQTWNSSPFNAIINQTYSAHPRMKISTLYFKEK